MVFALTTVKLAANGFAISKVTPFGMVKVTVKSLSELASKAA